MSKGDYVVAWPVIDLRRDPAPVDPEAAGKRPYAIDPRQETQLLYGETVQAYEAVAGWVRVEAPEQPEFTHGDRWQGYPGWAPFDALETRPNGYEPNGVVTARYARVRTKPRPWGGGVELPLGSRLFIALQKGSWCRVVGVRGDKGWVRTRDLRNIAGPPLARDALRRLILVSAKKFLGEPYYWGGRAGHRSRDRSAPSGVDCSALVNLAYRVAGFEIPRDAHEQFMASRPIARFEDLAPGDLVFLAKEGKPDRMAHVMIFAGGQSLIEAEHEANRVRSVTFKRKLGRARSKLQPFQTANGHVIYLGRLIPD